MLYKAVRLLLVKCYDNKMVEVTLQLGHLSIDSASGGSPTKKKIPCLRKELLLLLPLPLLLPLLLPLPLVSTRKHPLGSQSYWAMYVTSFSSIPYCRISDIAF